jgi:hypothetical protein
MTDEPKTQEQDPQIVPQRRVPLHCVCGETLRDRLRAEAQKRAALSGRPYSAARLMVELIDEGLRRSEV